MSLLGEQCASQGQEFFTEAIRQQSVATDAHEAPGQHMEEETAEELHRIEGHQALLAPVGIIAPAEADALAIEGGEAVVGDSHAVGVAAEVAENMFRSAEGRLSVDVPALVVELIDQRLEPRPITEVRRRTAAIEHASAIKMAESGEELVAEGNAQGWDRHEEHGMAGVNPALMVWRYSPGGNDGMDMGELNPLGLTSPRPFLDLLFDASSQALLSEPAGSNSRCAGWRGIRSLHRDDQDRGPLSFGSPCSIERILTRRRQRPSRISINTCSMNWSRTIARLPKAPP